MPVVQLAPPGRRCDEAGIGPRTDRRGSQAGPPRCRRCRASLSSRSWGAPCARLAKPKPPGTARPPDTRIRETPAPSPEGFGVHVAGELTSHLPRVYSMPARCRAWAAEVVQQVVGDQLVQRRLLVLQPDQSGICPVMKRVWLVRGWTSMSCTTELSPPTRSRCAAGWAPGELPQRVPSISFVMSR